MDKALGYLSLASKAGKLITGADQCIDALKRNKAIVGIEVCSNLYDRHIRRMFT